MDILSPARSGNGEVSFSGQDSFVFSLSFWAALTFNSRTKHGVENWRLTSICFKSTLFKGLVFEGSTGVLDKTV